MMGTTPSKRGMTPLAAVANTAVAAIALIAVAIGAPAMAQLPCSRVSLSGPTDIDSSSGFGDDMDVDGDTVVVGSSGFIGNHGYVAVYRWDGAAWMFEDVLRSSNPLYREGFGASVSVSGDTIVVGKAAQHNDDLQGAADVFVRENGVWVHQQELVMPDVPEPDDQFGWSVSVSGDWIAASARLDSRPNGIGSVHVFRRTSGVWARQKRFYDPVGGQNFFGESVALDGGTLVVSAPQTEGLEAFDDAGAVYVFRRTGVSWTTEAAISAPDPLGEEFFGDTLTISGDALVIGNRDRDGLTGAVDGARVYRRSMGDWSVEQVIAPSPYETLVGGIRDAQVDGDRLAVAIWYRSIDLNIDSMGVTSLFEFDGAQWVERGKIEHGRTTIDPPMGLRRSWGIPLSFSAGRLIVNMDADHPGQLDVISSPLGCTGDLNDDCAVDGADLGLMLGAWGASGPADLNDDGVVDGADLGLLLGAWGLCS